MIGYEILCYHGIISKFVFLDYTIGYMIPYGFAYLLGGRCANRLQKNENKWIIILSGAVFVLLSVMLFVHSGKFVDISEYKYPPRMYYLSYGLFMAFVIISLLRKYETKIPLCGLITFISSNSLWLYLWHIFVIKIQRSLIPGINWFCQYVIIVFISLGITYIQMLVIKRLQSIIPKKYSKYLVIFKG